MYTLVFLFQCKFDFCWVCQESWKRHSSATGGYFRCNRFEAVHKADEKQGTLISEAMDRNNQMQEMSRFLHFYTRFRNHENSQKLEEPLLIGVRQKMEILANSLGLKGNEGRKVLKNIDPWLPLFAAIELVPVTYFTCFVSMSRYVFGPAFCVYSCFLLITGFSNNRTSFFFC